MFAVTLSSLFLFAVKNYNDGIYILAVLAVVLYLLGLVLIYLAKESLKKELEDPEKGIEKSMINVWSSVG